MKNNIMKVYTFDPPLPIEKEERGMHHSLTRDMLASVKLDINDPE